MTREHVLVTGGAGFIGSHVCEALIAAGIPVVVLDDLSIGSRDNLPRDVTFYEGDVRDHRAVEAVLTDDVLSVIHLAARVTIRGSAQAYDEDCDVNLMGTLNVLKLVAQRSVQRFIFASSMAIYADSAAPMPVHETHLQEPLSPYGLSKLAAERYLQMLCPQLGMELVILRLFNTYGPRQKYTPYVGVINIFSQLLAEGQRPTIYGDGNQCRDFVYVGDVAWALSQSASRPGLNGIFNIGTGIATSVNQLVSLLSERICPGIEPIYRKRHPVELVNSIADVTAARRALEYKPQGRLETHVDTVLEWIGDSQKNIHRGQRHYP